MQRLLRQGYYLAASLRVRVLGMNRKILVIGSINADHVVRLNHFPSPGETVHGNNYQIIPGGKGANQAVACARLGGQVALLSAIGDDEIGSAMAKNFSFEKIDASGVEVIKGMTTGVALIFVNSEGENVISICSGANAGLTPDKIDRAREVIAGADYLLMQLEIPMASVSRAVSLAKKSGTRVILNPAPAQPLPDGLLAGVSILTPNQTEAELLTGVRIKSVDDAAMAADILHRKGVGTVIITMGSAGAYVSDENLRGLIVGVAVEAKDTTAAGDTFNGALAVGLSEGMMLAEAVVFANRCAAISVTRVGAQSSIPLRGEVDFNI